MAKTTSSYAPTHEQITQAREQSLLPTVAFQEQHPPIEPFVEHSSAIVALHPQSRLRIVEERTPQTGYGMDREENLGELGLSGAIEDSKEFAAELLRVLGRSLTLRNLRDVRSAISVMVAQWEGEIAALSGQPDHDEHGSDASTASSLREARRLGLKVTFGVDEVIEEGGFGVTYAAHGDDTTLAFNELVQSAADAQ